MTALIDLFPPERAEGPIEYFRRLSVRNGYADWLSLIRATGLNPSLNALWKNKPTLVDTLGLDPEWLDIVMPPTAAGQGLHDPFFRRTATDAVCPQCLAEGDHLHHAWSHSLVSACPDHGTALIDTCPSCGETLSQGRFDLATCDCGYALREAAAPSASPFERWVSARLAGQMRPIEGVPEIGAPEDYIGLGKLLFSLAIRLDPTAKVKPGKTSRPHDLAQTRALIESIRPLFEAWPQGFNTHVRDRLVAGNQAVFSPSGRLGAWYTSLHGASRKANAFAPLWTAFSDAMIDHFDGNLRGQQVLTPSPDRERRFVSVAEAARLIGVSGPKLGAALKAGIVAGHISKQGTAYTLALMDREEVERIRTERAHWMTANDAAVAAGVPPSVIAHLTEAGLLHTDDQWSQDILKGGPIEKASAETLLEHLKSLVVPREAAETLRFGQLIGRRTTDSKGIRRLYQAIHSGEVRATAYTPGCGLDGLTYATEEIRRYLGSVGLTDGMTLTQLEKVTGWKYEALSHWAQSGLLKTIDVLMQGRSARLVTNAALADFRRTWVPVSDLAQAMGTKSSALTVKITQRGLPIYGQLTLPSGAKRGGLLQLADLGALIG
jgi:hypothetical protein